MRLAYKLVYKIVPAALWRETESCGSFAGSPADLADGFIHFSAAEQVPATAKKYFGGQDGLLLLAVDTARLGSKLRFEPSRSGALFPHLYGALPRGAVLWAKPIPLKPDGTHDFSALI
ncbi:MAG TPA: DUF952 domain-containing protein [Methylocella sp.]|nr:DUF952 domain-containing protein [Methylocella sp.]